MNESAPKFLTMKEERERERKEPRKGRENQCFETRKHSLVDAMKATFLCVEHNFQGKKERKKVRMVFKSERGNTCCELHSHLVVINLNININNINGFGNIVILRVQKSWVKVVTERQVMTDSEYGVSGFNAVMGGVQIRESLKKKGGK